MVLFGVSPQDIKEVEFMSSEKKYTSVGIAAEVMNRLEEEVRRLHRSRSFIIEEALRKYYAMPPILEGEHADQP